jgi:predicted PurR-regulated permease PerM
MQMSGFRSMSAWTGLIGIVVVLAAMNLAGAVFAPVAFALFLIALLWPLQRGLQTWMPRLLALAVCVLVLIASFLAFASLLAWAFGHVARWMLANAARYQALYDGTTLWLENNGIAVSSLWADHFNVGWLLGLMQRLTGQLNTILTFWMIVLVYVLLGLIEVEDTRRKIATLRDGATARLLIEGSAEAAAKIRRYMGVRTLMSVLTGFLVWAFAATVGLPLAREWGVLAFVLNYIPFIGPFIATLLPTFFALTEFDSWKAVAMVFACLNIIQFVVGSYLEPRLSGAALAMSPFAVLFSIFLWTFLWGLPGTFIGVPIMIVALTFCAHHPGSRWLALLLGLPEAEDDSPVRRRLAEESLPPEPPRG